MKKASLVLIGLALAGCHKSNQQDDNSIDQPPLAQIEPEAKKPTVYFPRGFLTPDIKLNKYIEDALSICASGDYDGFRQLFGPSYSPPNKSDFDKIWHNVKSVQIASIHPDRRKDPPDYYVHAWVDLRQPDAHHRTRRDAIVAVKKDEGQWRLFQAPNDFVHRILVADSQPGEEPVVRKHSNKGQQTRPATAPGV